jgi:hypothetical protein
VGRISSEERDQRKKLCYLTVEQILKTLVNEHMDCSSAHKLGKWIYDIVVTELKGWMARKMILV